MADSSKFSEITTRIRQSLSNIRKNSRYNTWTEEAGIDAQDLILINNSFIYRNVKTVKSKKYLSIRFLEKDGSESEIFVSEGISFNSDFKHVKSKSKNFPQMHELAAQIEVEISTLGEMIFILIGRIDDSIQVSTPLQHEEFAEVVWNPSQKEVVTISDTCFSVRETFDGDAIWEELRAQYLTGGEEPPEALDEAIFDALDQLQDLAKAALILPETGEGLDGGVTDSIIAVLEEERNRYSQALEKCSGAVEDDHATFNEILRIAYNFASDAIMYLNLIVSVCDLKPIVLWGTLDAHYALSEAFQKLPWSRARKKPSLKSYIDIIGDARNSAFHNMFPFRKTLEVALPKAAVQGASLLIFSEYTKRKNNQLVYNDKELVDILVEFTRARQRQIPSRFWSANLDVMNKTIDLFRAASGFLKLLREASVSE